MRSLTWGFPCRVGLVLCKAPNMRIPVWRVSLQGPCRGEPCGAASARFLCGLVRVPGGVLCGGQSGVLCEVPAGVAWVECGVLHWAPAGASPPGPRVEVGHPLLGCPHGVPVCPVGVPGPCQGGEIPRGPFRAALVQGGGPIPAGGVRSRGVPSGLPVCRVGVPSLPGGWDPAGSLQGCSGAGWGSRPCRGMVPALTASPHPAGPPGGL